MRTIVIVVMLVGLALACAASFLVHAEEGGAATFETKCDPTGPPPSGADTLITCSFTAHNTGSSVLPHLQLEFQPGSAQLPDSYYFVSGTRDGAPLPVAPTQTAFDYGDLAPGASSTIGLKVIVRSSHPYDAVAVLAGTSGEHYARTDLGRDVAAAPRDQPLTMTLTAQRDASGAPLPAFDLAITNGSGHDISELLWVVGFGSQVRVIAPAEVAGASDGWAKSVIGTINAGETFRTTLRFDAKDGGCGYVQPAVLAGQAAIQFLDPAAPTSSQPASAVVTGDAVAGAGDCVPVEHGPGTLAALPGTGTGGGGRHGYGTAHVLSAAAAFGLLLAAAGLSVRRTRRC